MNKKVLRWNFVFQYGYVLTNIFNSIILLPLYLKRISQDTLGIWLATGNILAWMTLADPGIGDVLQQKIAELRGRKTMDEVGKTIGSGFMASSFVLLFAMLAGFVFYGLLGWIVNKDISHYPGLQWALILTVIATGFSLFSFSMSGINQGLHNSAHVAICSLLANVLFLVVNILLLFLGFGVLSIAISNLFRALFINVYNILAMMGWLKKEGIAIHIDKMHFRKFIRIFSFTSLSRILSGLSNSMDIIILARYIPPAMITLFEINRRPVKMTQSLIGRHSVALMPTVSHARGGEDHENINRLIARQFRYYSYAALFMSFLFCLVYKDLIAAWTGISHYAGNRITFLLVANFFVYLIGYFMSNMGYALGDIKRNSLVNIVKGMTIVALIFIVARRYGIEGTLMATLAVTFLTDFLYFSSRLIHLGYLRPSLVKTLAGIWLVIIIPSGLLLAWGCNFLADWFIPPNLYLNKLLVSGGLFTALFILLLMMADGDLREAIRGLRDNTFTLIKSTRVHA